MEKKIVKICRAGAVVQAVTGLLAGFLLSLREDSLYRIQFSLPTALFLWGVSFALALLLFAAGEMIRLLDQIAEKQAEEPPQPPVVFFKEPTPADQDKKTFVNF